MKHGKIIGILLIVCVAITFLGVASATEVVVGGEKFNIPDSYVKNNDSSSVKKTSTGTEEHAMYSGEGADYITIVVTTFNSGSPNVPKENGSVEKTINGVQGQYSDNFGGMGMENFAYISNDKLVMITKNPDSNVTLEDIVIKNTENNGGSGFPFNLFG